MHSKHGSLVDPMWPRPTSVAKGFLRPVIPREADEDDLLRFPPGHLHIIEITANDGKALYNVRARRHDGTLICLIESTGDYTHALYMATSAYHRMHEISDGETLFARDEDNIEAFQKYFFEELGRQTIRPEMLADSFGLIELSKDFEYETPYHLPEYMLFPARLVSSDEADEFLICRRSGDDVTDIEGPYLSLNACMCDLILLQIKRAYLFDWINPRPSDGFRLPSMNALTSPYG